MELSMLDPVTVLLIAVTQDAPDPELVALRTALVEAARGEANVVVETRDALPSEDEALAMGEAAHADMVTELRWQGVDHERVWMHVHIGHAPAWRDREITFRRSDAAAERGRAIGVVLAAMLPEIEAERESAREIPEPTPPAPPPPPAPAPPPSAKEAAPPPQVTRSPPRPLASVGIAAIGSVGLGGPAPEGGAAIDGRWLLAPRFALRAVGEGRFGSVSAANATAQSWSFGGGASFSLWGASPSSTELALRADVLANSLRLAHTAPTGALNHQSRWLPAADVALEGAWYFAPPLALTAAVGVAATLGTTDIVLDGAVAAHLAPLRGFSEIGIRVRF